MKNLIYTKDNSINPNGPIGIQSCGVIFWQKTGFLRHCNELVFQSTITLVKKKYSPTYVQIDGKVCFIQFDNDKEKMVFLSLKRERNSKHYYIYGESHTAYTNTDFHLFVLELISFIAKNIGCKFYVDDATGYLEHRSVEKLDEYIKSYAPPLAYSEDLLRKTIIEHQKRPLDINEILSRDSERHVVRDAYEFFMRQSKWQIDDRFNQTVQNFLNCAIYDGYVGNGGISFFLSNNGGNYANKVADALHNINAIKAERLLRKSFELFPNSVVPEDEAERNSILEKYREDFTSIDIEAYNIDLDYFCYQYLMKNKNHFLMQ